MIQRLKRRNYVDQIALTSKAASNLPYPPKELLVGSASEILQRFWEPGGVFLVVGALGAVTRLIAPLLTSKEADPAVVVLDSKGLNIIPLLGGHKAGAEYLAMQLAEELGGNAFITGDTSSQSRLSIDSFGKSWGWRRGGDSSYWKQLMLHQASGGNLRVEQSAGSDLWLTSAGAINSLKEKSKDSFQKCKIFSIGASALEHCCWHPASIWIGIGCERNISIELLERSLKFAFKEVGLAQEAVAGIATIDLKSDEPAFLSLAEKRSWPIHFFTAQVLSEVFVPNPSKEVESVTGTSSVAEAAALLAAGKDGKLLMKKQIYRAETGEKGALTIAISESKKPFAPQLGELHLIGSGPGDLAYLTCDARAALARSAIWIGYEPYLDLLEPIRRSDQVRVDGALTFERERCEKALGLAMEGVRVSLVSSGDSGIYGMAGLALELWLNLSPIERPLLNIHPGISAIQLAAAKGGAPLMNDFCTISLSDRLTPWPKIEERLRGAAIGDFVIAIYNPRSKDRDWQLEKAIKIVKKYRSANTPILLARQLTREGEKIDYFTLENCPINEVDMLSILLIGNSQSLLKDGWFYTPRGYSII